MEIADTLYGVAMDADGTSRVLSRRLSVTGAAQS
jgi:chromosome segregation ATPase